MLSISQVYKLGATICFTTFCESKQIEFQILYPNPFNIPDPPIHSNEREPERKKLRESFVKTWQHGSISWTIETIVKYGSEQQTKEDTSDVMFVKK